MAAMRLGDLETAIASFEEQNALLVTVHDLRQTLEPLLHIRRYRHRHPLCAAVKSQFDALCTGLDIAQLRRMLPQQPDGRVQLCHAGLVEWSVPVFRGLEAEWIIFAGVRSPGPDLKPDAVQHAHPPTRRPWPDRTPRPRPVGQHEAQLILESLRQLAARLWVWRQEWEKAGHTDRGEAPGGATSRAMLIYRFITENHTRPVTIADLAAALRVSDSRASHIVTQACGRSFRTLLLEARLRTAADLLRHSAQGILAVALHSGFTEITHFHRIFKARVGCTPRQYRLGTGA
jgi:AraC-like DNA-binding protein